MHYDDNVLKSFYILEEKTFGASLMPVGCGQAKSLEVCRYQSFGVMVSDCTRKPSVV